MGLWFQFSLKLMTAPFPTTAEAFCIGRQEPLWSTQPHRWSTCGESKFKFSISVNNHFIWLSCGVGGNLWRYAGVPTRRAWMRPLSVVRRRRHVRCLRGWNPVCAGPEVDWYKENTNSSAKETRVSLRQLKSLVQHTLLSVFYLTQYLFSRSQKLFIMLIFTTLALMAFFSLWACNHLFLTTSD